MRSPKRPAAPFPGHLCVATFAGLLYWGCASEGPTGRGGAESIPAATGGTAGRGNTEGAVGSGAEATDSGKLVRSWAEQRLAVTPAPAEPCLDFGAPEVVGSLETDALVELSGLVASRRYPPLLYAHADSGDPPRIFALGYSGQVEAEYLLMGASVTDWEDIAAGVTVDGQGVLVIGDIGDNAARQGLAGSRSEIQLLRLVEPEPGSSQQLDQWEELRLSYPDRAHDAETVMLDPVTGDLLIVTKEAEANSVVFRVPWSSSPGSVIELEPIAELELEPSELVTAGDISPGGDLIILRTYTRVLLWPRPAGLPIGEALTRAPISLMAPDQPQGEGITFGADGRSWLGAGEADPSLFRAEATCP